MLWTLLPPAERLHREPGGSVGPPDPALLGEQPVEPGLGGALRAHVAGERGPVELQRRRERPRPARVEDVAELVEARQQVLRQARRGVRLLARAEPVQRPRGSGGRRQEAPALHEERARPHVVRGQLEPELPDVPERELVRLEDPDGAHLGVTAALEAVAHGLHPAARATLGLQHRHLVAVPHQLVRRAQPREPGAEHHHAVARAPARHRRRRRPSQARQRERADGGGVLEEGSSIDRLAHACSPSASVDGRGK